MGHTRIESTAIPWKQSSNRSRVLENCRRDLAYSLIDSIDSSSSSPDSLDSSLNSSSLDSSVDALSAVLPVSTDADAEGFSILSHRNRKTSEAQTAILKQLLPDYHHHSANGHLHKFRARINFQWAMQFPETYHRYLLDRDEGIRLIPLEFMGVVNSPPGMAYPRMSEGVLDFDYKEVLTALLKFLRQRRNQLKNWFNNNRCTRIIPKNGSSSKGLQVKVVPSRLSRAVDLFSKKYYRLWVYPHVVEEAARRGLPVNDISLVRDMTTHIWNNKVPEIKADIAVCVDKERELIRAFKNGTLKSSDLTDDGKVLVIDSLYQQFGHVVNNLVEFLGWGVVIIAGGVDPRTGRIRTVGYNYGCTVADGKDFIGSFNDAAEAGYISGTNEESRNGPPPTAEQNAYVESPADIDPVTLVADDASDSIQAPVEANVPVPLPPAYPSVPSDVTPSMSVPSYSISSHPLPVTALTPSSVSSLSSPTTAPHPQRTASISPQPGAVDSALQSIEPLSSFPSETLMDTGSDDLYASSWAYSHSRDSSSSTLSGQQMDYSSGTPDIDTISQSLDFSHISWDTEMSDTTKDDNLARVMEALGLSDMFVSDTATDPRSTHIITESPSATRALSDSQSPLFDQPIADIIMDDSEAAADCHTMLKSDVPSAPSLPLSLPDIANLPRQRKVPPLREVTTLCGAEQELGPPEWHRDSLMALQDYSLGSGWISLVEKWYELESGMWKMKANTEGKYPLGKRWPQELNEWLDGSRQFNAGIFISDPSCYGAQLIDWWNHLNPAWRRSNDKSGFPQPDYSKSLKCLRKGGRQGIVTIIFGLFWWGRACNGTEHLWQRMVEDVSKMIDVLV
ncbi:uncharacterized protein ARMOST_16939 [Armillaria ostoyae]|uniref:Uncharacterized protein n=1 Tax=Armillaria ostoyae TaxID=47428 RepID=A0A284RXL5_ARMOS|nr:uncharacterized protein ARMOST_16939 [Armillaria ostoyae]